MVGGPAGEGGVARRAEAVAAFAALLRAAVAPLAPAAAAMARLEAGLRHRAADKGDHLLRAPDVARDVFFVHRGLMRYYFQDPEDGTERTGQFFDAGLVVTDAESFLTGAPATQSFEALEPSSVVLLPRAVIEEGYAEDHAIERFGRLMLQQALIGSQRRAGRLLTLQPEERYRTFVRTRPEVARRVPQYLIASYLGLTPESLSRIRRRIVAR